VRRIEKGGRHLKVDLGGIERPMPKRGGKWQRGKGTKRAEEENICGV